MHENQVKVKILLLHVPCSKYQNRPVIEPPKAKKHDNKADIYTKLQQDALMINDLDISLSGLGSVRKIWIIELISTVYCQSQEPYYIPQERKERATRV